MPVQNLLSQFAYFVSLEIQPDGLSTLKCENRRRANYERSELYWLDGNTLRTASADNLSWKYAGGGMEASPFDLMKFGEKLDKRRILSRNSLSDMTTAPDNANNNYAYGWDLGSHNGFSWYAKSGGQRGSRTYMRVYPDQNLVIVLMANTRGSGLSTLTRDIALEVLP